MVDSAEAYEAHARTFLRERNSSAIGARVVGDWSRSLRTGARVIELACGGGYPITGALKAAGLQVYAVDSSPTLIAELRSRFPTIPTQCARVQDSDLFNRSYDGAVAIGLLFLLSEPDQAELIARVSRVLRPGGRFLFTAPLQEGTWHDTITGLMCTSLGRERYEGLLRGAGMRVVTTYTDAGASNYYDVEKVQ